jgi:hypothetical protein
MSDSLDKVTKELTLYEHPFFEFSADEAEEGVDLCIRSRVIGVLEPEFHFTLTKREIEHPQFRWSFQSLLYGCLTDYMVELFTESPHTS